MLGIHGLVFYCLGQGARQGKKRNTSTSDSRQVGVKNVMFYDVGFVSQDLGFRVQSLRLGGESSQLAFYFASFGDAFLYDKGVGKMIAFTLSLANSDVWWFSALEV